jgi:uncharacterized protein (TIGR03435 family)
MKARLAALAALGLISALEAQPEFEAASVKPSTARFRGWSGKGGPGTGDPGRVTRTSTLGALVLEAYSLRQYELVGPEWLGHVDPGPDTPTYEFTASMAPGTTRAEYLQMLQQFLTVRFKIAMHRETRQLPTYKLVVAKGGPKVQQLALTPEKPETTDDAAPRKMKTDKDGYPILRADMGMAMMMDRARAHGRKMDDLLQLLRGQTGVPVVDATGLTEFEYTLSWIPTRPGTAPSENSSDVGPDLFQAVQQQLGLKLEGTKGPVEVLVIDSASKVPVEN